MATIFYHQIPSPIGSLLLFATHHGLCGLHMSGARYAPAMIESDWVDDAAPFVEVHRQLDEYFCGERQRFDVALDLHGTPFQRAVWQGLCEIGYGATQSYGELARAIGKPKAMRALGLANGRNPVAIIVPCHRVIGADGSLTGFGGGLERKRYLLELEARVSLYSIPMARAESIDTA